MKAVQRERVQPNANLIRKKAVQRERVQPNATC